ncbi:MAG TPA: hypothetical protein DIT25_03550 [Candidatus Moranbacteria bacterium]|nr:hypothetical protein [Candidatus Moranbacteria bacterium]
MSLASCNNANCFYYEICSKGKAEDPEKWEASKQDKFSKEFVFLLCKRGECLFLSYWFIRSLIRCGKFFLKPWIRTEQKQNGYAACYE